MRPRSSAADHPISGSGSGTKPNRAFRWSPSAQLRETFAGKSVLFVAHGFNVNQVASAVSLGLLDHYMNLAPPNIFVGVLWPDDSFIPIVDYPFEGGVAFDCGKLLADFCNDACSTAQSISFASHSLGARLVLEAVSGLNRKARSVCLTRAALNRDCLTTQFAVAAKNSEHISLLASHKDLVLKLAFPIGDPLFQPAQRRSHALPDRAGDRRASAARAAAGCSALADR